MKRLILPFLLTALVTPAMADWERVAENDLDVIYVDLTAMLAEGDLRRVETIVERKQPRADGQQSLRTLSEYDCRSARHRFLAASEHTGPMGTGDTLRAVAGAERWNDIAPGTPGQAMLRVVCGRAASSPEA